MTSPFSVRLAVVVVVVLFVATSPILAAELLSLTPIHDGSAEPPGFKIEATFRIQPAERPEELSVRVLRVFRPEPLGLARVMSTRAAVRDQDGNYRETVLVDDSNEAGTRPRLVTVEAIVAYRDLDLAKGKHSLLFEIELTGQKLTPIVGKSDVVEVVVSDKERFVADAVEADDLQRWQTPKGFGTTAIPRDVPIPLPARKVPGGYESASNHPQSRGFLAEVETAEIFFATNRAANPKLPPTTRPNYLFTDKGAAVSYGQCRVQVLRRSYDEKKAVRQRPLSFGELQNYFTVLETHFAPRDAWASEFAKDDVLLYVHGYHNSFEDTLLRATQLHLDLEFPGRTMAFSWPSAGEDTVQQGDDPEARRLTYFDDVRAADNSVDALIETLQTLAAAGPERRIHIVAHSMGNRLLLATLKRMADEGAGKLLDQVILAAPDVALDELVAAAPALAKLSQRPTIYFSTKDIALLISSKIYGLRSESLAQRAGRILRCYGDVDAISADRVNGYFSMNNGHSYFAEAPQMVQELSFVLCQRLPPDQRTTLEKRTCTADSLRSWDLKK